ncbi:MAG: ABC transporter permease [Phycisphaerales bacterium]|nr:ABC transporter permease [Phycisphaerales bacterium]
MYQALLTRRYLTSKVMPLLASLAVVLCVAMVLTVWSVMGGFLAKLMGSGRTLVGDVVVTWPGAGFAYYDDLIERLESNDSIAAATPVIETYGLLTLPSNRTEYVVVKGIEPRGYAKVTEYDQSLWWRPIEKPMPKDLLRRDPRLAPEHQKLMAWALENGRTLLRPEGSGVEPRPGMVAGIEIMDNYRDPASFYQWPRYSTGMIPIRDATATLVVLPLDSQGRVLPEEAKPAKFAIANEFKTGMFEVDNRTVIVPFGSLQKLLKMDEAQRSDDTAVGGTQIGPDGNETFARPQTIGAEPARTIAVFVRAKPGIEASELRFKVAEVYEKFARAHPDTVPAAPAIDIRDDGTKELVPFGGSIRIRTWEDLNATFISAVKKETGLVLFIFSFISLTAVFLVLAIFWSMVSEKTKDVGVLRSMGASRMGVAGLWLAYGLSIGIVGALLGGALAYTVVTNINPIHDWMGTALGLQIWDPRIYYFTEIPNKVELDKALFVMVGGALSSVVGAVIPALRAGFLHPVKALRFE